MSRTTPTCTVPPPRGAILFGARRMIWRPGAMLFDGRRIIWCRAIIRRVPNNVTPGRHIIRRAPNDMTPGRHVFRRVLYIYIYIYIYIHRRRDMYRYIHICVGPKAHRIYVYLGAGRRPAPGYMRHVLGNEGLHMHICCARYCYRIVCAHLDIRMSTMSGDVFFLTGVKY